MIVNFGYGPSESNTDYLERAIKESDKVIQNNWKKIEEIGIESYKQEQNLNEISKKTEILSEKLSQIENGNEKMLSELTKLRQHEIKQVNTHSTCKKATGVTAVALLLAGIAFVVIQQLNRSGAL